jgi:UDP-N-acetylmuramyl pentapeptide phosphotransferase/UDP-N-acetylglucosamine-1-phosphate transferase
MTIALLATFVVALGASVVLGSVMRRVAASIGAVVPPRPDRWHNEPTPTMGGVAIVAALLYASKVKKKPRR